MTLTLLCITAFTAGFVDAIAGGGGLIQLPVLLLVLSTTPTATILGTNKLIAFTGTAVATFQYTRRITINWRSILPAAGAAFALSFLGARVVSLVPSAFLRPVILVLLALVAGFVILKRDFGTVSPQPISRSWQLRAGLAASAAIGFYDGFFGPGTGSFLIFALVSIFALDFLHASASAKVINAATNLSALLYFAISGQILYDIALPMIACNVLGGIAGARLAIARGSKLVRVFFIAAVCLVILRLGYDLAQSWLV
ncbi:MAG TPA: TSUP family transporter [Anaerolineaceae bacterium]